ncbi:thiol reductant ABC exporter subunit CydC [Sporichthya polymorpha]|uniref:thiol reductant ABC exporter subunit CydC n=1 Tax=Sporichthya polymorpha TaxID=35751 RepID=UPI00035FA78C|nr:thiol reductant ABC exporter subunit CydC [Sporichthya polymorpha]
MTGPVLRLLRLARPAAPRLALAALLGCLASLAAVGLTAVSAWLISRAAQHPPVLMLMVAIVAVRTFGIGRGVLRYAERLVAHDAALRLLADVRVRCFEAAERIAPAGLRGFNRGDLTARFAADVDAVPDVLVRGLLPLAVASGTGLAAVVLLGAIALPAGLILLAGLVMVGVVVPLLQSALAAEAERAPAALRGRLAGQTVDLVDGLDTYRAYGAVPDRLAAIAETERALARADRRSTFVQAAAATAMALVVGAVVWTLLAFGTHQVHAGGLDPVLLAVVVLTPIAVFEVVGQVPEAVRRLDAARGGLTRVFEVLDAPAPVAEPATPATLRPGPHTLRVEHLRAGWPDGPDVLHDVCLELRPGHRVAVVGESGSGKSTLAAAILRFVEPRGGAVLLDGVDTRTLAADDVRRVVATCGQDAYLFDSTIRANLVLARPDASDHELWAALDAARLGDWLRKQPRGLDTAVGPAGSALSGGQARRLALARALLTDAEILILDEPTEHLDPATAAELMRDLLDVTAGRTTLLITHDRAALRGVDAVVELVHGRSHTWTAAAG